MLINCKSQLELYDLLLVEIIARDHPACLSSPYRSLSTLSHQHEGTRRGFRGAREEGRAVSFMPVPRRRRIISVAPLSAAAYVRVHRG